MNKATTVKQVLTAARWIIENIGWCQGAFYRDQYGNALLSHLYTTPSSFCAAGAIRVVEADHSLITAAMNHIYHTVNAKGSIGEWNDAPSRTKEQVLEGFDKAITTAEE